VIEVLSRSWKLYGRFLRIPMSVALSWVCHLLQIVRLLDATVTDKFLYLFLEISKCPLPWLLGLYRRCLVCRASLGAETETGLPEEVAALLFQQLASGVAHCHQHGICHRDIKLDNLHLSFSPNALDPRDVTLKLIDFGFATGLAVRFLEATHSHDTAASDQVAATVGARGNTPYLAPEVLLCVAVLAGTISYFHSSCELCCTVDSCSASTWNQVHVCDWCLIVPPLFWPPGPRPFPSWMSCPCCLNRPCPKQRSVTPEFGRALSMGWLVRTTAVGAYSSAHRNTQTTRNAHSPTWFCAF